MTVIISKVNRVETVEGQGGRLTIRKTYTDRAVGTGIVLPLKRSVIERRVAARLARIDTSVYGKAISVCAAVSSAHNINIFPYIYGHTLRELPQSKWPASGLFRALGAFLARIERLSTARLLSGLQISSRKLGHIIRLYKAGSTAKLGRRVFTLGDATLANMIFSHGVLYLIDFEFAHVSSAGCDVGLLAAEMDYRGGLNPKPRYARKALMQGYVTGGGKLRSAMAWRNRAAGYQLSQTNVGG